MKGGIHYSRISVSNKIKKDTYLLALLDTFAFLNFGTNLKIETGINTYHCYTT